MKAEEKPQPYGEKGVRFSLDEVARRATEGSRNPRVRRWAIEQLSKARDLGAVTREEIIRQPRKRAEIILKAAQQKLWVADPVGTEFMQGAHLTACETGKDCFHGGDCDDLSILTAASLSSVGIPTLIVGHSYNDHRALEHVLCAVHVDNEWKYADPSTEWELGRCARFTRERVIAIPSGEVVCDGDVCVRGGNISPDVVEPTGTGGTFIGVDGVPAAATKLVWVLR